MAKRENIKNIYRGLNKEAYCNICFNPPMVFLYYRAVAKSFGGSAPSS